MFNDLIDTASRRGCSSCEQARRLDGMVSRAAGGPVRNRGQLADSFGRVETLVVGGVAAVDDVLRRALPLLGKGGLGIDVDPAGRAIRSTAASIRQISGFADSISHGAATLASGNSGSSLGGIGSRLRPAVGSASQSLGQLQQAFAGAYGPAIPSALPPARERLPYSTSELLGGLDSGLAGASFSNAHLLVLTTDRGDSFYFNLSTAAFDSLRRQTSYNIASQDRLSRRPALQAVSKGGESVTVSGAIFTKKSGADQLNRLRRIGFSMEPLLLTTGYGEALGQWYLSRIEEEQEALFADGMPRMQKFSLEFQRYGEDYSDI